MTAYYNENDPFAAQWLRNLISAGHIAAGEVDERSIEDVKPDDLRTFTQCHFFAGIGGWSFALRLAGWSDERPVWTGSCPCQPFSAAGKRAGFDDERHLWPAWHHLIRECLPGQVFGEQVASKAGLGWFDLVQADFEAEGYACGAIDLGSAGIGAPHLRQRLWFYAERLDNTTGARCNATWEGSENQARDEAWVCGSERGRSVDRLAQSHGGNTGTEGLQRSGQHGQQPEDSSVSSMADSECEQWQRGRAGKTGDTSGTFERTERFRDASSMADASGTLLQERGCVGQFQQETMGASEGKTSFGGSSSDWTSPLDGIWRDSDWLYCTDGKWRPVEPGTFPLAHGASQRVGRLRAYGNAINPYQASEIIEAFK